MAIAAIPQPRSAHPHRRKLLIGGVLLAVLLLPQIVFEVNLLRGEPTASGAEPAYPLNHAFDADIQPVGTPPTNSGFETAAYPVGTGPTNSDFSTGPSDMDVLANHNFDSGLTTSWAPSGAVSLQNNATQGNFARFDASSALITSDAFTVSSAAQKLVFEMGTTSASGTAWLTVKVKYGVDYGSESSAWNISCSFPCAWQSRYLDMSPYQGQSIKVQFNRHVSSTATYGIDRVRTQSVLAGFELVGTGNRDTESGNGFARLDGGYIVSGAFSVDTAAQFGVVDVKGLTTGSDQYYIYVLSGTGFGTSTQVTLGTISDSWEEIRFNIVGWRGQQVKLKIVRQNGIIGVDDVGVQMVDVPSWDATAEARRTSDGNGGTAISTNGDLTSQPFQIPANVQQMSVRHKGTGSRPELLPRPSPRSELLHCHHAREHREPRP